MDRESIPAQRVPLDSAYWDLKNHLIAATGLAFYADRDSLLRNLISERLSALHLTDFSGYTAFLSGSARGSAEMDILVASLTNGETSFFRDQEHYDAIRDVIVPDILRRRQAAKQLRIWSAGCASGAEPYSLAILLEREFGESLAGWQIAIHATDLNRSRLACAAAGKFRQWALRATSEAIRQECFSREGLTWTIHPRYRRWISFDHMNLVGSEFATPWPAGTLFDLILCRNVMIYFAPEENRRLVGQFHHSLESGGWLVVGATECNPENYQAFQTVDAAGTRLYQKANPPYEPMALAQPPQLPTPLPPVPAPAPADMAGLRQLADRGDWPGAAQCAERLLLQDLLNPAFHFYQALIFDNLGNSSQAERSLRQAIYLDRNFALAHYHLGLALKRDRKTQAAERSFRNVLHVLAEEADDAMVAAGAGLTAAGLRELASLQCEPPSET